MDKSMRQGVAFGTIALLCTASVATGIAMRARPRRAPAVSVGPREIWDAYDPQATHAPIDIRYPFDGAAFPPESIAPTFAWSSAASGIDAWLVRVSFAGAEPLIQLSPRSEWTPDAATWSRCKDQSVSSPAKVTVLGYASGFPERVLASGSVAFTTSTDPVGAPIFYREVVLPFIEAVKDPARIRWRFGTIDAHTQPPIVLDKLPVCGNCHSFSADGRMLGMDVDYANDKGSYVVTATGREMLLSKRDVITWSDFQRADRQPTFGLLSQLSPDGRYVVSTVKDRSVFVPKPDLEFSQLFFPLKGILAYYDRATKRFAALPGADDPAYVHSNPTWSPDGKEIVFARAKAFELKHLKHNGVALLTPEECREFLSDGKTFRFDLYRIPFNAGKGGKAVAITGAAENGRSNFFAKFSPDGKWIVYCQANSFMLLQPDSELYIVPSAGGPAQRLLANTKRMNSWHSWSPNGKWLVFASKALSPYTQLFLTHLDAAGISTPPIVLAQFTAANGAANIPEFVPLAADAIGSISQDFVNDDSYMRTALENVKAQDPARAAKLYEKALSINPNNAEAHAFLGGILTDRGELSQAQEHLSEALRLDPKNSTATFNRGNALAKAKQYEAALAAWRKTIELDPKHAKARNNSSAVLVELGRVAEAERLLRSAVAADPDYAEGHQNLGNLLSSLGQQQQAIAEWTTALRLDDRIAEAHQNLGIAWIGIGQVESGMRHLEVAVRLEPNNATGLLNLGTAYAKQGDMPAAIRFTEQAADVASRNKQPELERECLQRIRRYRSEAAVQ